MYWWRTVPLVLLTTDRCVSVSLCFWEPTDVKVQLRPIFLVHLMLHLFLVNDSLHLLVLLQRHGNGFEFFNTMQNNMFIFC